MLGALSNQDKSTEKRSETQIENVTLTKYCCQGGCYNVSDRHLAGIYRRIVKEKSINKIFFDCKISNTNDFINYFKNDRLELFLVSYNGQESGFFWLKEFFPRASFITYCLYKSFWGEHTLKISQTCIDAIFDRKDEHGNHEMDILMGLTPANNKLALRFLKKNGIKIIGTIPNLIWDFEKGNYVDGILSYRNRKNGQANKSLLSLFSVT